MSNMRTFHVNQFVCVDVERWPCLPKERFLCEYDCGTTLETTTPRMGLWSKLWRMYERYPYLERKASHTLPSGAVSAKSVETALSHMYEDIIRYNVGDKTFNREEVWHDIYRTINETYNRSIVDYKPYTRGLRARDYHEIYTHPDMIAIRKELRPNPRSISVAHGKAQEMMLKGDLRRNNTLVSDSRSGIVRLTALNQILVCRGFNTRIDDAIYPTPIMENYYEGIRDPAAAAIDSALASKAYIYQSAPLEKTEYANRKLQFPAARVDLLIESDCGSTDYIEVELTEARLPGYMGMWFVHPDHKGLVELTPATGKVWMGQTLQFRAPLLCKHRHMQCVCEVCYGTLFNQLPYGTNLGINSSCNTQSILSQLVLEVKHVEALKEQDPLVFSKLEQRYVNNGDKPGHVYIGDWITKNKGRLLIRAVVKDRVMNGSRLPIVTMADLDPQLSMVRHSQFKEMFFEYDLPNGKRDRVRINVCKGNMASSLTVEFLRWFIPQGYTIDSDGFYKVELTDWDPSIPFLELPAKHISAKDFSSEVEVFIRSSSDNSSLRLGKMRQLSHYTDIKLGAVDLFDLINTRIDTHFSHVNVICLSMLIRADDRVGCKIPRWDEPAKYAKFSRVMSEGSFSALAAYQSGKAELLKPEQYTNTDRNQHLLDPLWLPKF